MHKRAVVCDRVFSQDAQWDRDRLVVSGGVRERQYDVVDRANECEALAVLFAVLPQDRRDRSARGVICDSKLCPLRFHGENATGRRS